MPCRVCSILELGKCTEERPSTQDPKPRMAPNKASQEVVEIKTTTDIASTEVPKPPKVFTSRVFLAALRAFDFLFYLLRGPGEDISGTWCGPIGSRV